MLPQFQPVIVVIVFLLYNYITSDESNLHSKKLYVKIENVKKNYKSVFIRIVLYLIIYFYLPYFNFLLIVILIELILTVYIFFVFLTVI